MHTHPVLSFVQPRLSWFASRTWVHPGPKVLRAASTVVVASSCDWRQSGVIVSRLRGVMLTSLPSPRLVNTLGGGREGLSRVGDPEGGLEGDLEGGREGLSRVGDPEGGLACGCIVLSGRVKCGLSVLVARSREGVGVLRPKGFLVNFREGAGTLEGGLARGFMVVASAGRVKRGVSVLVNDLEGPGAGTGAVPKTNGAGTGGGAGGLLTMGDRVGAGDLCVKGGRVGAGTLGAGGPSVIGDRVGPCALRVIGDRVGAGDLFVIGDRVGAGVFINGAGGLRVCDPKLKAGEGTLRVTPLLAEEVGLSFISNPGGRSCSTRFNLFTTLAVAHSEPVFQYRNPTNCI